MNEPVYTPEYLEERAQQARTVESLDLAIGLDGCARRMRELERDLATAHADNSRLQLQINGAARSLRTNA
jgi:hypothetical protein